MLKEPVLQISHLGKRYGDYWAVKDLSLTVYKGEVYGFLGRNGAGKTTTIRMIMDLIKPTTGTIQLFTMPKGQLGNRLFYRIGATIEYPGFYPNLTAHENLYYNAKLFGVEETRIHEVLGFMGLTKAGNQIVKGYSLGMKQRLGLARALLHNPEFIILDEPTNGLDPAGIKEIREAIMRLNQEYNITIFVSSHILSEVEQIATKVGIIHNGTLSEEITLEEMYIQGNRYLELKVSDQQRAITFLNKELPIERIDSLKDGLLHVYGQFNTPERITRLLIESGIDISHIVLHQETLEDRFMRITGDEE